MISFTIVGTDEKELYVGQTFGIKRPVLAKLSPGVVHRPLAYFRDQASADEFVEWMSVLVDKANEGRSHIQPPSE